MNFFFFFQSFDRVLVQNILHGLSPSLSDAIASIPRWLLIKVVREFVFNDQKKMKAFFQAFPHVMHACSAAIEHSLHSIQPQPMPGGHPSVLVSSSLSLSPSASSQLQVPASYQLPMNTPNLPVPPGPTQPTALSPTVSVEHPSGHPPLFRLSSATHSTGSHSSLANKLNATEIRLFHTLHYLISDAASQNQQSNSFTSINIDQLLPLNTIQLFIYLFIPYIHTYLQSNEREFLSHPDLAQGMRLIWQPLLEYRQPNIRMFSSFVKPIIPSYASPNENGDYLSILNDSSQQQQQQSSSSQGTFYINNSKRNRLSVLIESPTPIPTTRAIIEEADEDIQSQTPPPLPQSTTNEFSMHLSRSVSEKHPLSDLTNQPSMIAPIVSSEGSSTSLFQPMIRQKDQKSTSPILADSETTTTNNSITDLSAYGTNNGTKPRAPLVHMSSICSISDSSRLTTSPQSPGKRNKNDPSSTFCLSRR